MTKPNTSEADNQKSKSGSADGGMDWSAFDALTEAEVEAALARDPDAAPTTPDAAVRLRRVSPARFIRLRLSMSREAFAEAYDIPLTTLIAWERHESEPTTVELAYLRAIIRNPQGVRKMIA